MVADAAFWPATTAALSFSSFLSAAADAFLRSARSSSRRFSPPSHFLLTSLKMLTSCSLLEANGLRDCRMEREIVEWKTQEELDEMTDL